MLVMTYVLSRKTLNHVSRAYPASRALLQRLVSHWKKNDLFVAQANSGNKSR